MLVDVANTFPKWWYQLSLPSTESPLLDILTHTCIISIFTFICKHSSGHIIVSHLMCISLMTNETEYFLKFSLVFLVPSFVKCLKMSLPIFLLVCCLHFMSSLYTPDTSPCQLYLLQISWLRDLSFHAHKVVFDEQNFLILMLSTLSVFILTISAFCVLLKDFHYLKAMKMFSRVIF